MRTTAESGVCTAVGQDSPNVLPVVAESESRPEVIWGRKNIEPVALGAITVLTQVRNGTNPELANLTESIEKNDLINQIDVARMDRDALEEYIVFVNQLWGSEHVIDDCPTAADGKYYLCIAGHSRVAAIKIIADKDPATENHIDCKIHDTPTPMEIISLQLNENIHSKPSEERQAMAIVETYFYGFEKGLWQTRQEFVAQNRDKFSNRALVDALHYAKLPEKVRNLPETYRVKVELGKMVNPLRTYFSKGIIGNIKTYAKLTDEEHIQLIDKAVCDWLGLTAAHVREQKMSNLEATRHIRGYSRHYRELNASRARGETINLQLDGPERELELIDRKLVREYQAKLRALGAEPIRLLLDLIGSHGDIVEDGDQVVNEIAERIKEETQLILGGAAIGGAEQEESLF